MKKNYYQVYLLGFLLFFFLGNNALKAQCSQICGATPVIGKITPDSLWIPCGFSGPITVNFTQQNGFPISNFCNKTDLAPFLQNNLVNWFPFCTPSSSNHLLDKSGNGNNFIPSSPDTFLGVVNYANFNSNSDDRFLSTCSKSHWLNYSSISSPPFMRYLTNTISPAISSSSMNLAFWYRVERSYPFIQNRALFEMKNASNAPVMQIWNSNDTSTCSGCNADTLFIRHQAFTSTLVVPFNTFKSTSTWIFVSVSIDASGSSPTASVYINGQLVKTSPINLQANVFGTQYQFGRINSNSGWTSQGIMSAYVDDIFIHSKALSAYENLILFRGYRIKWNNSDADSSNSFNISFPNPQSFFSCQLYIGANTCVLTDTLKVKVKRPEPFLTPPTAAVCISGSILFTLKDTINTEDKFSFQSSAGINLLPFPFLWREVYLNGVVKQAKAPIFDAYGDSYYTYTPDTVPGVDTLWFKEWNFYNQAGCDTISNKVLIRKYQLPPVPSIRDTSICQLKPTPPIDSFIKKNPLTAKYRLRYYADSTITDTLIKPVLSTSSPGVFTFFASQVNDTTGCEGKRKRFTYTILPTPFLTSDTILSSICSGTSATSSFTSNLANTSFSWVRSVDATLIPATRSGTGNISDLISSSSTATVVANYTITLTNINGCSSTKIIRDTVLPRPILSNTVKLKNICNGTIYRDTFKSATTGTTFSWTRNLNGTTGTGPASGSSAFLLDVLTNATVNPIIVSYPVTISARGCVSNDSLRVTVNPTPIMTTNQNPSAICSGQIYKDTIKSSTSGATFSWTRNTVGLTPVSTSSATAFINETLTNSGTAKITAKYVVSMTINSCTKVDTIYLTVHPIPTLSSSKTPSAICSGKPFNYSATSATKDSILTWSRISNANITAKGPASGSNNIVNDTLINTTNTYQTQSYVYTVASNGCSKTDTVKVVVNPIPKLSSLKNIAANCSGAVSYTPVSSISPIVTSFAWTRLVVSGISNGSAASSNNIGESLINITSNPIVVPYYYTLTANGCSFVDTVFATVNPTATINSPKFPTAICSGQSFNYKATSATSGVVFGWKRIDTSGITPSAIVTFTPSDTISEVLTNSNTFITRARYVISLTFGGCTRFDTVFVNVNPRPRFNPTPTLKNICNNAVYADTMRSLTAGTSYSWTRILPSGVTGSGNVSDTNRIISQTLNNANTEPQTVIYPTVLTANGCTNLDTFRVRVNPTLILNSNKNLPQICSGDTVRTTLTSSTNNVSFSWTRPLVSGILPLTKTDTARNIKEMLQDTSVNSRIASYVVTMSLNGCSNLDTVKITINPKPKLSSTKTPSPICSGTAFSYTPLSGTSSVSFAWNRPAVSNITASASTPGIGSIVDTLKNSTLSNINVNYIYSLTANSCSSNDTVVVTVVPPPSSNLISVDTIRACGDSTQITSIGGMTTYTWSNGKTTQNIFVKTTGWYKLTATNSTGCTGNDSVFVSIVKGNIINNDTAICLGNSVKISADSIGLVTFLWSTGATISNINVTPNSTTKYWVQVSNGSNVCTDSMTVTVKPLPKLNGSKTASVSCSGIVSYGASSTIGSTTMTWKRSKVIGILPDSSTSVLQNINESLINTTSNPITTYYYYTLTANGCSQLDTVSAIVNPTPQLTSAKVLTPICSGDTFKYKSTSSTSGVVFGWKRIDTTGITPAATSSFIPSDSISEVLNNSNTFITRAKYAISLTFGGCTRYDTIYLNVNPTPKLSPAPSLQNICNKGVLNITLSSSTTGTTYSWTRNLNSVTGTGASSGSSNTINDTLTNATTNPININYPIILTANGCQNKDTIKALINPTPKLNNIPTTSGRCGGLAFNFTATSSTTGASFAWSRAAITGITPSTNTQSSATISESLNNSTTSPIVVSYIYTTTINSCSGNDTIRDTIYPSPSLNSTKTATVCSGSAFSYTATSATSGTVFSWTRPVVTGITTTATPGNGSTINDTLRNTTTSPIVVKYIFSLSANGCTRPDTVSVTVNPRPKLQAPKTTSSNCSGLVSYTGTSATTGTSFAWVRNAVTNITPSTGSASNATINETLTNSTANPISVNYIYTLTANSCSEQDTVTASIIPTPSLSSTKTPTPICSGDTFKYKATTATSGATFSWIRMANANITPAPSALSNNDTIGEKLTNTSTAPTIVKYVINLTANGCTKVDTVNLTVNPTPKLSPAPSLQNICNKGVLNITLSSSTTGTTYSWTRNLNSVTGTGASSGSSNTINDTLTNATTNPININYPIILTANGCQNKDTIKALINPTPKLNNIPTTSGRCGGLAFNFTATSSTTGASFAWSRAAITGITPSTNTQSSATISESLNNSTTSPIVVSYIYTTTINSCSGNDTIRDTIYPSPSLNSTKTATVCSGSAFSYTATSATSGTVFSWTRPVVTGITTTATPGNGSTINDTLRNTTTSPIVVKYIFSLSANGCTRPDTVSVTVNPRPKLQAPKTTSSNCSGLVSYTGTSATTGTSFAWVRNAVTNITPSTGSASNATINETLTNSTANPISVNYIYTLTANGCSEQDTVTASIIPTPSLSSAKTPTPICSGDTFKYKATTATSGATFSWIRMTNANITPTPSALSNNDTIGEKLTNTSTAPTIVKYVINLTANGCTKVDTVNLTVNPTPKLSPAPSLQNICNKGVLNITLSSSTTGTTYNWTRNLNSVTGTGANSGSSNTINDTLTNATTNPININYPIILTANGCQNKDTIKALINPTPKLNNIPTTAGRCGGLVFNFTATSATTGASFAWSRAAITGITPSTNTQSSATINETLNNSTTSPIVVSYIYTTTINSCSGNDTIRDTIYPSPSLNSAKTATICSGNAFSYTATSATSGTVFSWTRPVVTGITTTATPGNGSTINDTLRNTTSSPIVVKYILSLSANGCSRPDTVSVTVNPRPKLNSTKTITAACSGLVSYSPTSATTGASFVWSRLAVSGIIPVTSSGSGSISETISDTTVNILTTKYYFTITANGCSELDTLTVTVNPSPVLSSNKNPGAVCSGSLFSYTPSSATSGTTFSWSRATVSGISNAANTGTSGISETLINTTTSPIIVTYVYTLTANTCSKTDTVKVKINPLPTANIMAPKNYFCVGDSLLLTADTFPKYTYQWRLNTSNISGATTRFLQVKAIGNYDVIVTDSNGCVRTSSVFNITSKPNPSTKIDTLGPVSVCIGGSIALRADTLAKARFQWFKNGTALSADTNRFISALSAGNYTYKVIDSNGCSSISSPTAVFFNNVPNAAASALGSTNFCQGASATLMSNISPGSTYQWRKNNVDIAGENTIWYTATTTGGYNVKVCNGGCCVVSNTIMVNADTPPTATISPTTLQNICAGSTATLTASSGVGYTYQWQVNGILIAGATNSTYIVSDSGNYTCNISKGACTVAPPTVRVEIRPIPPVPFNIGNKTYCQGEVSSPVTASANLGNILKWYTTATGGVGSTTAPTPSTLIADTIKYYVTQVSAFNCESPRVLLTVIVNPTPLKPTVANISYCQGAIASPLSATLTTGDTLLWYNVASGGVGSIIAPTPSTTAVGVQTYYVSQKTKLGCEGPRDTIKVTIKPTPSFPIVNDIVYCQNYPAVPLTATLTTGDTLLWYTNGTGGVGSKIAPTPSTTTVGTFFFYVSQKTSLSCEGPRDTIKVTVNPTPLMPNAGNVTYCQGDSSLPLTATLTSDTLLWYTSATGGTASYIAIKPSTAIAGTFKFYVSQKNTFGCESPRKEITVVIHPTPKAPKVSNIDYCQGQVVGKLTATADPGNILLWYTSSTGGVGDTNAPTPSTIDTGITTYYVSQKTSFGCESPRDSIKVQINFKGKIPPTTRDTTYCQWQKVDTLTARAFFGNTLLWYSDSTTTTHFVSSPKPNTAIVGAVYYYVSQITSKGCESPRALLKVTVNPTPLAPTTQSISYCQGIVSDTLIANVTPGNVLKWYADSIGGIGSTSSPAPSTMDTGILIFYVSQINKLGCESPRSPLNVRIFAPYKDTIQITNCVKIIYKNKSYFSPSVVLDTIKSFRGCDSVYRTAILNVLLSDTVRLFVCAYGQTYQYNGTYMGSTGVYQFKSKKINGCDSVVILDLKLQEVTLVNIDTSVCDQFEYRGISYTQSTLLPKDTIKSIYGCDSIHRFYNFIVSKPISIAGEIIEKCDSILFRNQWYFASTNIEDTIKKQAYPFCDSIFVLNQLNVIHRAPVQIYANPDTVIIEGDTVELFSTPSKTYKWSTGGTLDMIKVFPRVSTTYTITVSDDNNCLNSDTIKIRVKKDDSEVSLPNAFSPNGDFVNDVFKPDFYGKATLVQMMVFNRWGEKVYECSGNYCAWDGTYFGEMQPSGVYSYYIVYTTTVNRLEKKGTVTLIR